jgi:hypothetical protein
MARLLAQGGVTHRHKPGAATAYDRHSLALLGELMEDTWGEFCGLTPDIWLGGNLKICV